MRKLSFFIATLLFSLFIRAQDSATTFTFNEVGWTIKLPHAFKAMSVADNEKVMQRGANAIEEASGIKADLKATKTLLAAVSGYNFLTVTVTHFDPKTDGSYKASNQLVKNAMTKTFQEKLKDAVVDTATTQITIDGVTFDRFRITVILKGLAVLNSIMLSDLYKGYDFGISYVYVDDKAKAQLDEMLRTSTFKK